MDSESGNTLYQPLDSSMAGVNCSDSSTSSGQGSRGGIDRHKRPASSDGSPAPLIQGGSGRGRAPFDVSSESGGGSDGEGGLKPGSPAGGPSKKTISFWVGSHRATCSVAPDYSSAVSFIHPEHNNRMCPRYDRLRAVPVASGNGLEIDSPMPVAKDATSPPMAVWPSFCMASTQINPNPTSPRLTNVAADSRLLSHAAAPLLFRNNAL